MLLINKIQQSSQLILSTVYLALFTFTLIIHGGGAPTLYLFLQLMLGSLIVIATGFVTLKIAGATQVESSHLLAIVIGALITSLAIDLCTNLTNRSAGFAFVCWSVLVVVVCMCVQPINRNTDRIVSRIDLIDHFVLLSILLFVLLWCWTIAGSFPALQQAGTLFAWVDYYLHGAEIVQFADPKAIGHGTILLAGEPLPLYHRGIYMLPAAIAQIAYLPGIAAATAILLPLGLMLLGVTIYTLGVHLSGRWTGIFALICLFVLPDSSLYGLKNGFFGYHYNLLVSPGTAYGIAACLASMIFFIQGNKNNSKRLLVLSIILAMASFFFRAHIFILYFPCFVFLFTYQYISSSKLRTALLIIPLILFISFLILMVSSEPLRDFWLNRSAVLAFLDTVHLNRGPTTYSKIYHQVLALQLSGITIFIGIALLYVAILGAWIILYPSFLYKKVREQGWELIDQFPLVLSSCYAGIILFFPPAWYGDVTEYQHRPFGLLYTIVILFSVSYGLRMFDHIKRQIPLKIMMMTIVFIGILLTVLMPTRSRLNHLFRGASRYQDYQIPINRDIVKASIFLRAAATSGDIFLISHDDTDPYYIDSASIIASIAGLPAYVGRPEIQSKQSALRKSIIDQRLADTHQVAEQVTFSNARSFMLAKGIAWYVALSAPKWDPALEHCQFKSGSIAIYHN